MNDIRRTILWVVFGFSLVMLWDQWQIHNGKKPTFFPSAVQTAPVQTGATAQAPTPDVNTAKPAGLQQNNAGDVLQAAPAAQRIDVETDVLKLQFSTEGGSLVRAELLKHKDIHHAGSNVLLMDDSKERVYLAQSGLIGAASATGWPTHKTPMVFSGSKMLKESENELQ